MPIEVGLWRLGDRLQPVAFTGMDSESRLESVLAADVTVVYPVWLFIGHQVRELSRLNVAPQINKLLQQSPPGAP